MKRFTRPEISKRFSYFKFKFCFQLLLTIALIATLHKTYAFENSPGTLLKSDQPLDHSITGTVVDENGEALAGVTIQVKGTDQGTSTDNQGRFSLNVPDQATLVASFIGFQTQEVTVSSAQSTVNIKLLPSTSNLNELVVTGYTSQAQKDITGAISTVKGSDLTTIPMGNVQKQLQGKVSGVTITASGEPGSSSTVRIRGFGSFTNNNPLYVVDGVPTDDVSNIPSEDIADVTVLKDAATASVYGARAFAGVILITTKRGKEGKLTVNYDGSYGWQFPGHGYDLMNPTETAQWTWNAIKAAGGTPNHKQYGNGPEPVLPDYIMAGDHFGLLNSDPGTAALVNPDLYNIDPSKGPFYQIVKANKAGTNWYKEVTQIAPIQSHNLGLSGGNDNSRYNIQLGYFDQKGIVLATYLKRYTIRSNTEFTIHDRVKIGENIQVALRDNPTLDNGNLGGSEGNAFGWAYRENPLIPVYDIMGNFAGTRAAGFNNPHNPVADQERTRDDKTLTTQIFGNVYAELELPYNFKIRSSFGGGYDNTYYKTFTKLQYEDQENNPTVNKVNEGASFAYNWVWTNTLTFEHLYGEHSVKALLGEEALGSLGRNVDVTGSNPFSDDPNYMTINTTESNGRVTSDGGGKGPTIYSLFAQVNYSFKDRYLLSGTVRRDGSAVFGASNKFGVFPAVSAGWRISQENFMQNIGWITDLKLRGSYGEMGNSAPVPLINLFNTYAASPEAASYDINGTHSSLVEGLRPNSFANPDARWETNKTLGFGFDASLFKNSFTLTVDWYKRSTEGLLFAPEVEATVGFLNAYPTINIGSMRNTGVDIQAGKTGEFGNGWKYNIGGTFTTYKNEILKIANGVDHFFGDSYGAGRINGDITINQVGHPMSSFYGYKVIGLWQTQEEIDAADASAAEATDGANSTYQDGGEHLGEFRYADVNDDGVINDADRTITGNPNPDFTYGITAGLSWRNFDLNLEFYGVSGGQIFNYTRWYTDFYSSFSGGAISKRVLNSWTPQNTNTNIPIFEDRGGTSYNNAANSYYLEGGSYFRNRNIQVGYTFNKGALANAGIERLRVYVQAINLFTITNYSGLDPAISGNDDLFGVDYGNWPMVKQFIMGVSVTF